jgi:hypothetical protein
MHELALRHGESSWTAVLIPLRVWMGWFASFHIGAVGQPGGSAGGVSCCGRCDWQPRELGRECRDDRADVDRSGDRRVPSFAFVGVYDLLQEAN